MRSTTVTEVISFLGLAGYYRRFMEGFSLLALPLMKLMPKGENDASKKGLGCVLMQHGKVIAYASRLCVPDDSSLREAIWTQAPSSPLSIHPVSTKMYRDLKQNLWWNDGQTKRTIQTLEDMLRSYTLEWTGNWDEYLCLVEFAYNNSWHASIKGAPFELLYGQKCKAPICWNKVGERVIEGPKLVEVTNEKVAIAKKKLKEARSRQKSYVDRHRRALEFKPKEHVFLK
ncbi:retrotransposon protein, putative, ty3-gypsy subclass, partial [Tanacetum coccineum]